MSRLIDLTGQTFGMLTVIERAGTASGREALWLCRCNCGREKLVRSHCLRRGMTRSCGCKKRFHGMRHGEVEGFRRSKVYILWGRMLRNAKRYRVPVCPEWHDAGTFCAWARSHGWRPGLYLSRINILAGWYPENAVFSTVRNHTRPAGSRVKAIPRADAEGRRRPQG